MSGKYIVSLFIVADTFIPAVLPPSLVSSAFSAAVESLMFIVPSYLPYITSVVNVLPPLLLSSLLQDVRLKVLPIKSMEAMTQDGLIVFFILL